MAVTGRCGGATVASSPSIASRSRPEVAPADWRNRATSFSICSGASTTTLTCGKVVVRTRCTDSRLAWRLERSFQAQAFRPSRLAATSSAAPQRAGRHCGARSKSTQSAVRRFTARARLELANSDCARSQPDCAASSQRWVACCSSTGCCRTCSASAATPGSATQRIPSGNAGNMASAGAASGRASTPSALASTSVAFAGSPIACSEAGSSGVNSGTMREIGRSAASSACTASRSHWRPHTATQTGSPARAFG